MDMINMALKLIGTNLNEQIDKYISPLFIFNSNEDKLTQINEVFIYCSKLIQIILY